MPSSFPGMNPYLEHAAVWQDFHSQFCVSFRTALVPAIRPKSICQVEERHDIHEPADDERRTVGHDDITVAEREPRRSIADTSAAGIAASVPGRILPDLEMERETRLEIQDGISRELDTAVELLSPTNKKRGTNRNPFLAKRGTLLESSARYVEIDLLRGGDRLPGEGLPPCDDYALVSRTHERPAVEICPCRLRQPLPAISTPLRPLDPDVSLDLQADVPSAYEMGAYDCYLYGNPPDPPLLAEHQAWADDLIKNRAASQTQE